MGLRPSNAERSYTATLNVAQRKAHHIAQRYPSGRPSKGGANRSSNIKRVINERTIQADPCPTCGGVLPHIFALTQLYHPCSCPSQDLPCESAVEAAPEGVTGS